MLLSEPGKNMLCQLRLIPGQDFGAQAQGAQNDHLFLCETVTKHIMQEPLEACLCQHVILTELGFKDCNSGWMKLCGMHCESRTKL